MNILLNQMELDALSELPLLARCLYVFAIKPRMDIATGMVGINPKISWQALGEWLYIAPHPGVKGGVPSKGQLRRAAWQLEKNGLVKMVSLEKQLIFECLLVKRGYCAQNKADTNPTRQADSRSTPKKSFDSNAFATKTLASRQVQNKKADTHPKLIKAKISAKETSRITVVGDRIKQFFVNHGRLVIEKDETKGDLYLTPTEFFKEKDISLFITSEGGKTFSLSLTPTEMPSDTIAIKPAHQNNSVAQAWETENPYEDALIKLIQAMYQGEPPKGYQVSGASDSVLGVRKENKKSYEIESVTQYAGSQLQGYAVTIKNSGKEVVELTAGDFGFLHPLAIAIEQNKLYPTLKTRIFVVARHG